MVITLFKYNFIVYLVNNAINIIKHLVKLLTFNQKINNIISIKS